MESVKLSVIIVNYNVCHLLEQALQSVKKASSTLTTEIFVVDNNSVDGSVEMVEQKFLDVHVIANKVNTGFSKANNQAIKRAKGEYILLLNPDTLVETNTFAKSCTFMDEHPEAGGLGVMMLDGKGNYLPESKRGLPTPWVAFYKIFGLSSLFPNSKKFGKYHLSYLDKNKTNSVDILSGAFMLLRSSVLEKVGLLDENFFMYGEDIDLSYRITKAGHKLYYFPETRIIHYKGESTKKTSVNYVLVFYNAMIIFAKKHFSNKHIRAFSFLINTAIYFRAGIAIVSRFLNKMMLPIIDAAIISAGMLWAKNYWELNHKFIEGGHYPVEFMLVAVPFYILMWLTTVYFSGGYDKPLRYSNIFKGIIIGTILISAITNFIDPIRFSKALIILGAAWSIFTMSALRIIFHFIRYGNFSVDQKKVSKVVIVGSNPEALRVYSILKNAEASVEVLGYVYRKNKDETNNLYLGPINNLREISEVYKVDEIIFCSKDISSNEIMDWMLVLERMKVEYRIISDESNYIIGSNSFASKSGLYTVDISLAIMKNKNKRNKRMVDILTSAFFLMCSPFIIWFTTNPFGFLRNALNVLIGRISWVGLSPEIGIEFPDLRRGVLTPWDAVRNKKISEEITKKINNIYAKDYSYDKDLNMMYRDFRCLGRQVG